MRTTNNVLGDAYTCAIVEQWSQAELKGEEASNEESRKDSKLESNAGNGEALEMSSVAST